VPSIPLLINRILGRNGIDPPQDLPDDMAVEVLNMDFDDGSVGRKRSGASAVTLNDFSAGGVVSAIDRYVPSDNEAAAELHCTDSGTLTTIQRLTGGTTWAAYTLADAIQANPADVSMVNFNGKFYQAYNSTVNRLHVYPSAGGTHRRVGLAQPAAPTTSVGGGAVTDVRKYGVCWTLQESGVTVLRSNLSALSGATTMAPNAATITRPTAASESETHWECYAFTDDDNYALGYLIATTAIATTTATDNNATLSGSAPPTAGANTPPPSAKYLLTDGTHLIGAGAWETSAGTGLTPSVRMIWWTPALGTTDTDGDGERVSNTSSIKTYLYVDRALTGIGGPLQGNIYAFGYRDIWKLVPTGQATNAYERLSLRTTIGCIRHQTIVMGEDESGRPALYWLSHIGPHRIGAGGIEYIGRDIEDRWATVNLDASNVAAWGIYVPNRRQVWWFVSSGASQNDPNEVIVFDCRRGRVVEFNNIRAVRYGWSRFTGVATEARCGVLFSNTLGASMSRELKPYIGRVGTGITVPTVWKLDTGTQDGSTNYQAYAKSKAFSIRPGQQLGMIEDAYLLAETSSGVTITLTVDRDFGVETSTATAVLTAAGSETRKLVKIEGASVSQAGHVQFQIGDSAAANNTWTLDGLVTPLLREGPR